jgi:hypothetical protein
MMLAIIPDQQISLARYPWIRRANACCLPRKETNSMRRTAEQKMAKRAALMLAKRAALWTSTARRGN